MKRKKAAVAKPATPEPASITVRRPVGNRFVRWAANLWVVFHFTAVARGRRLSRADVGPCHRHMEAVSALLAGHLSQSRLQLLRPPTIPQHARGL